MEISSAKIEISLPVYVPNTLQEMIAFKGPAEEAFDAIKKLDLGSTEASGFYVILYPHDQDIIHIWIGHNDDVYLYSISSPDLANHLSGFIVSGLSENGDHVNGVFHYLHMKIIMSAMQSQKAF